MYTLASIMLRDRPNSLLHFLLCPGVKGIPQSEQRLADCLAGAYHRLQNRDRNRSYNGSYGSLWHPVSLSDLKESEVMTYVVRTLVYFHWYG